MIDPIRDTVLSGKFVLWEDSMREGAQAKTLMSGRERVLLGEQLVSMFGDEAYSQLIISAGFP